MIANSPIHCQQGLGAAQEHSTSSGSSNWLGRNIRVLAAVTCLVSGAAAAASAAAGLYPLAVLFGLVSIVSGFVALFGGSNDAVGASETNAPPHKQPDENNNEEDVAASQPSTVTKTVDSSRRVNNVDSFSKGFAELQRAAMQAKFALDLIDRNFSLHIARYGFTKSKLESAETVSSEEEFNCRVRLGQLNDCKKYYSDFELAIENLKNIEAEARLQDNHIDRIGFLKLESPFFDICRMISTCKRWFPEYIPEKTVKDAGIYIKACGEALKMGFETVPPKL